MIDERFDEAAPRQLALSRQHCTPDCAWYHGPRLYLRALGIVKGIGRDSGYLVDAVGRMARAGTGPRVLISASADCATLAHVIAGYRAANAPLHVTFVDRCGTPIAMNRWFAEQSGVSIDTHHAEILTFDAPEPFDLICTHAFLGWFDPVSRRQVVAQWRRLLRPGGVIVTAGSLRPHGAAPVTPFDEAEIDAIVDRTRAAHDDGRRRFGLEPQVLDDWATVFARRKAHYPLPDLEGARTLFEGAGFDIVELLEAPGLQPEDPVRMRLIAARHTRS